MVSITLITGETLEGKAKLVVFKTVLDPSKTLIRIWPSKGVDWKELDSLACTNEFWVTPGAEKSHVLKFGCRNTEVFKVPCIETWAWFLRHRYPHAIVRLLPTFGPLPSMLEQKKYNQPPFKLSMLKLLFHDMRNCDNSQICQNTAKWLASLECQILKPFEFIQHERHWQCWDDTGCDSEFRTTRTSIFEQPDDVTQGNAMFFWEKICEQYQKWATDGISKQTCSNLEQAMKQWE